MTSLFSIQIFHAISKAKKKQNKQNKTKTKKIDFCFKATDIWCHMDQ